MNDHSASFDTKVKKLNKLNFRQLQASDIKEFESELGDSPCSFDEMLRNEYGNFKVKLKLPESN